MCVCVCVHIYVLHEVDLCLPEPFMCVCECVFFRKYINIYKHVYTHIFTHTSICTHAYINIGLGLTL